MKQIKDQAFPSIRELDVSSDEPSSAKFARWVITYASELPLDGVDPAGFMRLSNVVAARERQWVHNPVVAVAEIRADPGVIPKTPITPDDPYDFRLE